MNKPKIFEENIQKIIENNILNLLNSIPDFENERIFTHPRAVGDITQNILEEKIHTCFPSGLAKNFDANFGRRALEDISFMDNDDNYFAIDIKTHNRDTKFNMPNLTSVEKLSKFYKNDKNYFVILLAEYKVIDNKMSFDAVRLIPIEHLKWDCLSIGALGWGQIQITNSRIINIDSNQSRKEWMLKLCEKLNFFYPKEISKIEKRITHFEKVRKYWTDK